MVQAPKLIFGVNPKSKIQLFDVLGEALQLREKDIIDSLFAV
jgi:hypothetical protein